MWISVRENTSGWHGGGVWQREGSDYNISNLKMPNGPITDPLVKNARGKEDTSPGTVVVDFYSWVQFFPFPFPNIADFLWRYININICS